MSNIEKNAGSGSIVADLDNGLSHYAPERRYSAIHLLNACRLFRRCMKYTKKQDFYNAFWDSITVDLELTEKERLELGLFYIGVLHTFRTPLRVLFMVDDEQRANAFIAWIDEEYTYKQAVDRSAAAAAAAEEEEEEDEDSKVTCHIYSATPAQH